MKSFTAASAGLPPAAPGAGASAGEKKVKKVFTWGGSYQWADKAKNKADAITKIQARKTPRRPTWLTPLFGSFGEGIL